MNTATTTSKCPEAGSGEHLWMEGQDGPATCHHCRADQTTRTVSEVIAYNDTLETARTLLAADKVEEASALLDQIENQPREERRTEYAIEMYDGTTDRERRAYGVVHRAGCGDLRDPEPVGTDWRAGVSNLGTDWELDVEDGLVRTAPCAR